MLDRPSPASSPDPAPVAAHPAPVDLPLDPLSEILQDFRLVGVSYGRCELHHPWGIDFPAQASARLHFVGSGPCFLYTAATGWTELAVGDLVLLPRGTAHRLASTANAPCRPIDPAKVDSFGGIVHRLTETGEGPPSVLFCGRMSFEAHALHPLIDLMPELLRSCDLPGRDPLVAPLLSAMSDEIHAPRLGGATVLARLTDLLAARVIRLWVECACSNSDGWLAAVRDPQVGRALAAIHREPGRDWTLEQLARTAGLSRSVFADRFGRAVGEGPGRYLARWRMRLAGEWLGRQKLSVAEVATRLGYESEASFARAFKRITGTPPGQLRRSLPADSGRTVM